MILFIKSVFRFLKVFSILPKNERKQFDLRHHSSKGEFFGRIEDSKKSFMRLHDLSRILFDTRTTSHPRVRTQVDSAFGQIIDTILIPLTEVVFFI